MNWHNLNWIDYIIVGIIVISSLISLIRGFIREALSLASWIIAFWVALTFNSRLSVLLQPYLTDKSIRTVVSFFVLFAGALIIGAFVNYLISTLVEKTGLSGTDRLLGIVFGFGRGVLLVAILLLVAQVSTLPSSDNWKQSQLVPIMQPVEIWLKGYLPIDLQQNLNPDVHLRQILVPPETKPKTDINQVQPKAVTPQTPTQVVPTTDK